jgi:quinoprotein glucose dehydrogenase
VACAHASFRLAVCLVFFGSAPAGDAVGGERFVKGEWRHFGGDLGSAKYSALDQIDESNVANLRLAWTWNVKQVEGPIDARSRHLRVTPLMVQGRLHLITTLGIVVALDPGTGQTLWTYDPKAYESPLPTHGGFAHRAVEYWSDGDDQRIIVVNGAFQLIALDARTGKPCADFGEDGIVDLSQDLGPRVTSHNYNIKGPATVCRDTIVFGCVVNDLTLRKTMPPGDVFGYDVRTGKLKWVFHTVPQENEFGVETWKNGSWRYTGNTNVWSWITADEDLGHFYLPIGTPTDDWYGGHRLGDGLFGESIVCLDAETGKRVWHFQTVRHGIWDYDLPTPPIPVDITVDGQRVQALAQVGKNAFTYVLDRVTGEPVWPIEERPVPQSNVPGEKTSATQPFPTKPPPFDLQGLATDDLIDFTPQLRAHAVDAVQDYVYGPLYTPPIVAGQDGKKGTISVPGINGGACTVGGAFDPDTGQLYVQSMTLPWILALRPGDPNRSDLDYTHHSWIDFPPRIQGLPIVKPPYARLTAINLNSGDISWQSPLGEGPRKRANELIGNGEDVGRLGSMSVSAAYMNGPLVTKTLLFDNVTHSEEEVELGLPPGGMMYAFEKSSGDVLFERYLPHVYPSSMPMTYLHDAKQYITFTVTTKSPGKETQYQLHAYALPD